MNCVISVTNIGHLRADLNRRGAIRESCTPIFLRTRQLRLKSDSELPIRALSPEFCSRSKSAAEIHRSMKNAKKKRAVRTLKPAELPVETVAQPEIITAVPDEAAVEAVAAVVTLPASCTLRETIAVKALLMPQLDTASPVTLDAGAIERIDTAALQVLTAFVRVRRQRAAAVEWRGLSRTVTSAAGLLGLAAQLGLPAEG